MTNDAELARLRAEAAQAQADAAQARAVAAQAALEAAQAQAAAAAPEASPAVEPHDADQDAADPNDRVPREDVPDDGVPGDGVPTPAEHPADVQAIIDGYRFDAPMLPVGALLTDTGPQTAAQIGIPLAMTNRHGLVAGATGTGKTRTLQVLAEGLSSAGVPVFLADIKGDLSGLAVPGTPSQRLLDRTEGIGQSWEPAAYPVEFYSLGGLGTGVPIRTTVTDFGPLLLARVLGLNPTQESGLSLIFHWADTQGLALLDLTDLRTVITYLTSDDGKDELRGIGGLSTASAGVILRQLASLQAQGADAFFGEPALDTRDLLRTAADGRGVISALQLPAVADKPALFSTFLMWLLADLFAGLPEVGDRDKPALVFFFDEAHLLFNGASKAFVEQVTQTVRLIRSKGVGIFFVTQTPQDVPKQVLAQLGSRIQHALRAYTPDDAKALRAAVRTYPRTEYDLEALLTSLGIGEAVVTFLDSKGVPTPVAWTRLRAPQSSMDPAPPSQLDAVVAASPGTARYAVAVDNESAHELLQQRMHAQRAQAQAEQTAAEEAKQAQQRDAELRTMEEKLRRDAQARQQREQNARQKTQRAAVDSFLRSAGSVLGREITRTIFGTRRR